MLAELAIFAALGGAFWAWRALTSPPTPTRTTTPTPVSQIDLGTLLKHVRSEDVELSYTDRDNISTARRVTIREIWGKRGDRPGMAWANWIVGYCHLRREERRFSVRRINWIRLPTDTAAGDTDAEPWLARRYMLRDMPPPREPAPTSHRVTSPTMLLEWRDDRVSGSRWTVTVDEIETRHDGSILRFSGKARRERTASARAWSGRKTFYVTENCFISLADGESGELVANPEAWLRALLPKG